MDQAGFIESLATQIRDEKTFLGLFLGGSLGRGTADAYSDVDMIAIVETEAIAESVATWRSLLESISPIVFWNQRGQGVKVPSW